MKEIKKADRRTERGKEEKASEWSQRLEVYRQVYKITYEPLKCFKWTKIPPPLFELPLSNCKKQMF